MPDLLKSSPEILGKFQKVIEIILEEIALLGNKRNRLTPIKIKIPIKKLEQNGLFYNEVETILNRLEKEEHNIIQVISGFKFYPDFLIISDLKGELEKEIQSKSNFYLILDDVGRLKQLLTSIKRVGEKDGVFRVSFDSESGSIIYGNKRCKIPYDSKQYYLCKIMFTKRIGERVNWDEIADRWKGYTMGLDKAPPEKEDWREVYDAVNAVNKKVKTKFDIGKIFQYKDKTVIRLK